MRFAYLTHVYAFGFVVLLSSLLAVLGGVVSVGIGLWGVASGRRRLRVWVALGMLGVLEVGFGILLFYLVFIRQVPDFVD